MDLRRDRTREGAKGLGNLWEREVSPTNDALYTDLGWLAGDGTTIDPQSQVLLHTDEAGDLAKISMSETAHKFSSFLDQVGQDEIDFIRNAASKYHSLRYYGMMNPWRFQYKCAELAQIVPIIPRTWKAGHLYSRGKRRQIWNASNFLRFNGSSYSASLGDVCDADNLASTGSFVFDFWVRIKGNDGTQQVIMSKKTDLTNGNAGWWIERGAGDKLDFYLSNATQYTHLVGTNDFLKDHWHHVLIATYFQTNQNTKLYVDGVYDKNQSEIFGIFPVGNAVNMLLGKGYTAYGQVDLGDIRIHKSTNVLDFATMAADHYAAEASYYATI